MVECLTKTLENGIWLTVDGAPPSVGNIRQEILIGRRLREIDVDPRRAIEWMLRDPVARSLVPEGLRLSIAPIESSTPAMPEPAKAEAVQKIAGTNEAKNIRTTRPRDAHVEAMRRTHGERRPNGRRVDLLREAGIPDSVGDRTVSRIFAEAWPKPS
jgi:hypothetical protein